MVAERIEAPSADAGEPSPEPSSPTPDTTADDSLQPLTAPEENVADEDRTMGEIADAAEATPESDGRAEDAEPSTEPDSETSEEPPAEPEPTPPVDIRATPEYRALQSAADQRVAKAETDAREARQQIAAATAQQQVENAVTAFRGEIRSLLTEQGFDATQGEASIERAAASIRQALVQGREQVIGQIRSELEGYSAQQESQNRSVVLGAWADRLTQQHSLASEDVTEIRDLIDNAALTDETAFSTAGNRMQRLAERLGTATATRTAASTTAKRRSSLEPEKPGEGFVPAGPGAAPMTDTQWLAAMGRGEVPDDFERAVRISIEQGLM